MNFGYRMLYYLLKLRAKQAETSDANGGKLQFAQKVFCQAFGAFTSSPSSPPLSLVKALNQERKVGDWEELVL